MRKIFLSFFFLLFAAWNINAQNGLIDKVVAVVGREMILLSDVESEVNLMRIQGTTSDKNIRCEVLENLLLQKLLLAQARLDSLRATDDMVDEQIERRLRMVLMQLGGEKAAEEYFRKPIFQLKKDWQEPIREQILTQQMQATLIKDAPITPNEVEKVYRKIPKDSLPIVPIQYVLRQIVINPPAHEAKFEVRERLLELRDRISKGEKFSTLAILYSEDPSNAMRGGELGLRSAQEYAAAFANAAMILKPGQVSPIVETEFGFHLIQMIEKENNDMFNVRHILLKPKYTIENRITAFQKLDSIADAVKTGQMTFREAALKLSQDTKTNTNGGLVVNDINLSSRFEKDQLSPSDYSVLRNMAQGDISVPYESQDRMGNTVYKIIYLEELIPSHSANLVDDYAVIQQLAKQRRQEADLEKWITQKQATALIRIDPLFDNCEFKRDGWRK